MTWSQTSEVLRPFLDAATHQPLVTRVGVWRAVSETRHIQHRCAGLFTALRGNKPFTIHSWLDCSTEMQGLGLCLWRELDNSCEASRCGLGRDKDRGLLLRVSSARPWVPSEAVGLSGEKPRRCEPRKSQTLQPPKLQ